MTQDIKRHSKVFLSNEDSEASNYGAVCWDVEYSTKATKPWVSGQVRISDCSKNIYLDFDASSKEGYLSRRRKLDKLILTLQQFGHELDNCFKQVEDLLVWRKTEEEEKEDCCANLPHQM